ncbi:UDP-N-acetylmuramoyl-L-alanine--D-glutamate ligase [Fangia hongkongensis]|uniref:UDP-N-acetylmuramoyl-L-alanine--D-glutamate ligase n=1 Tax=Fangia hongkongensis TaxID=270495 RepID=UPI000366150D|nr:UDP-N-acetylmuramoyl-L-alanine--D-glutamate ligase [Fangia hongkongensis]MBK2123737.1 UDP-N-acetylmuramoyl-L-alanine--D-glutamate ligase [Fangia hongkongensis]
MTQNTTVKLIKSEKSRDFFYQQTPIKSVLIIGLGASNRALLSYLENNYTLDIALYDQSDQENLSLSYPLYHDFQAINLELYDLIIPAPGIPINRAPFSELYNFWHKVVGDIELFCHELEKTAAIEKSALPKVVAVTGSNGKSTVVSLLHHVLLSSGMDVALGGNIGTPVFELINQTVALYVLELSSFQIDLLKKARFEIITVLNISEDHLDRYPSFEAYAASKLALVKHANCALLPTHLAHQLENKTQIAIEAIESGEFQLNDQAIIYQSNVLLTSKMLSIKGTHNLYNALVVLRMIEKLSFNPMDIVQHISHFQALAHRCNSVARVNEVDYINDSKATNIGAVIAGISGLTSTKNVILLLGGIAKGADFSKLKDVLKSNVCFTCIYGQDRFKIEEDITNLVEYELAESLDQAFDLCASRSKCGDIVLLAPGCASFDAFSGFAERGSYFEKLVYQWKAKVELLDENSID